VELAEGVTVCSPAGLLRFCVDRAEEIPNRGLLAMLEAGKYTDVSFIVEGRVVMAHRIIVGSQSSYFER
jgi:hypothetical protein